MPRGGYRPGAGRPRGSKNRTTLGVMPQQVQTAARELQLDPLTYMLSVMNDPAADPARRDRMAIAAAPYAHPRAGDVGKKERAEAAALEAGNGTDWDDLLQ